MPLRLRVPHGDFLRPALVAAAVVSVSAVRASAQPPPKAPGEPVRISRLPCRVIAKPKIRKVIEEGWDRSQTIRHQCEELARGRAVVLLEWGSADSQSHAKSSMTVRDDVVVATVRIPPLGDMIVLLAHELQHVVEKTQGIDVEVEAARPGSGVRRAYGGYETQAAVDVSRLVAQELRDNPRVARK